MIGLLWVVPVIFLVLFVSVRQDLRAQQLEKRMTADQARIEVLSSRLQELRFRLSSTTTFSRLEPMARGRGLRPVETEQVLAVATGPRDAQAQELPNGVAGRLMAGLVEFLGPEAAQAAAERSATGGADDEEDPLGTWEPEEEPTR